MRAGDHGECKLMIIQLHTLGTGKCASPLSGEIKWPVRMCCCVISYADHPNVNTWKAGLRWAIHTQTSTHTAHFRKDKDQNLSVAKLKKVIF